MKHKLILLSSLFILASSLQSQSVKQKKVRFRYEILPNKPLPEYAKFYEAEARSDAKDGIPINERYARLTGNYIHGLRNITPNPSGTKEGFYAGGLTIGFNSDHQAPLNSNDKAQIKVSMTFSDIELIDKFQDEKVVDNPSVPGGAPIVYQNFLLKFKFPFHLKVTEISSGKALIDTIIIETSTHFPNEYNYNTSGQKTNPYGYLNRAQLDLDYNQNTKDLYLKSKDILGMAYINWAAKYLSQQFGFAESSHSWALSYIKTKNPLYDVSDTALNIIQTISDTIEANTKNKTHLNWHCKFVKQQIKKVISVYESFLIDSKYADGFKDAQDKNKFMIHTKKNLVVGYLFNDEFEKADKLYKEIENQTMKEYIDGNVQDETMRQIGNFIAREKTFYSAHKNRFHFD